MAELARALEGSFSKHAAALAHRVGESRLTYAQLNQASGALARFLSEKVPRGQPVMVYGERSHEMVSALFGCLRSGNPYVPAGELLPPERCREMAAAAGCRLLLDAGGGAETLGSAGLEVIPFSELKRIFSGSGIGWQNATRGDELAYVLFTSGSTGSPKGVKVSAANLESFLSWTTPAFGYEGRATGFLNQAPFHFDLSVYELYNAATTGGSLLSLPSRDTRDPESLFRLLFSYASEIEVWVSTPSFLRYSASHPEMNGARFPALRQFVLIGEVFPVPLALETIRRFPAARVLNFYGPTEATVAHTVYEVTEASLSGRDRIPIGRCKPGGGVFLEEGEIVLTGANVALGYANGTATDDGKFFVKGGQRCYRTGDLGELDADGLLHFRGRADTQVKVNGFRVELGEIERALSLVPGIIASSVMLVNKESTSWIVAFVQSEEREGETELGFRKRLKLALSGKLPSYMLPKRFVRVREMPMNRNGKLDRDTLRGML